MCVCVCGGGTEWKWHGFVGLSDIGAMFTNTLTFGYTCNGNDTSDIVVFNGILMSHIPQLIHTFSFGVAARL